jgi:hypothetical protein
VRRDLGKVAVAARARAAPVQHLAIMHGTQRHAEVCRGGGGQPAGKGVAPF